MLRLFSALPRHANKRPEAAVNPQDWFDSRYSREIRLKHVSVGALCFASGATFPAMLALAATEQWWPAAFFAAAGAFGLLHAIPQARLLIQWQWLDRRRALDVQRDYIKSVNEFRSLYVDYAILAQMVRRGLAEGNAEDGFPSAEIVSFHGGRRDN